ncbi:MAG: CPBP family intramembrane metalloprotease [Oscillospiraceae bacterium]|jgi:membrane protease YdiL (CAAX protease family)|nr:CPBP family intramembrane metalloprotease [Oscillospiraceae bacterium]
MISQEKMTGKRALWFAVMTFAFTYATWGLVALNPAGWFSYDSPQGMILWILGGFSPAIVMFALIKKWGKTKEERACFKPIFRTARGWKPAMLVTGLYLAAYLGIAITVSERVEPWYMLVAYFPVMIVGGGLEEIGWRGFFQPAMERKLPFWLAAPIVGVIWAAWHIPLWFIPGTFQANADLNFLVYAVFCVFLSYILGALQRLTGNVAASISFHAWVNVMFSVFMFSPFLEGENIALLMGLMTGFAVAATASVYICKRLGGSRS